MKIVTFFSENRDMYFKNVNFFFFSESNKKRIPLVILQCHFRPLTHIFTFTPPHIQFMKKRREEKVKGEKLSVLEPTNCSYMSKKKSYVYKRNQYVYAQTISFFD